jgi:hypothetical protein
MPITGRDILINGESMVTVKGGAHLILSGTLVATLSQLGLSSKEITITPYFVHKDMIVDDFGADAPADVQWKMAFARIRIPFIHVDKTVLGICVGESMGGSVEGTCGPSGTPLGGGWPVFSSGNHLISLNIASPQLQYPWRFRATYMEGQPYEFPVGTNASIVMTNWRAIPYQPFLLNGIGTSGSSIVGVEILSSGAVLWDRTPDT